MDSGVTSLKYDFDYLAILNDPSMILDILFYREGPQSQYLNHSVGLYLS